MSSEWTGLTLGEIVTFKTGKLDSNAAEEGGRYPFFTCSPNTLAINSYAFDTEAVILAGNNANGVFAIKHYRGRFNAYQRTYVIEPISKEVTSCRYAYYLLRHMVGNLKELSIGSATKFLTKTILNALPVRLPPKLEQDEIAVVLSALDDRITLLRETNATLETIAQALFKSWFVDFDPVRAKMSGRAPEGMDEATAALFPDALEESDLGLVPKGWQVSRVGDVAEVVKGKSYSSKDLVSSHHTALVTLKSFERGGGFRMDGFKPYVGTYKPTQVVQAGDLIIAYTDVTQAAELIGKPAIVVGVDSFSTLVASLDVGIVRPEPARSTKLFLYGLFNTETFQAHTLAHTSGTTVLHLAKDGVGSFLFPCPPMALIERFESVASALMTRKQVNSDAISTLSELRDTLLPRLISGQLRLPEITHFQEALSP